MLLLCNLKKNENRKKYIRTLNIKRLEFRHPYFKFTSLLMHFVVDFASTINRASPPNSN